LGAPVQWALAVAVLAWWSERGYALSPETTPHPPDLKPLVSTITLRGVLTLFFSQAGVGRYF
jgi:hypothetical protein